MDFFGSSESRLTLVRAAKYVTCCVELLKIMIIKLRLKGTLCFVQIGSFLLSYIKSYELCQSASSRMSFGSCVSCRDNIAVSVFVDVFFESDK